MNVHPVMSCTIPKRVEVAHIAQTPQSQPKASTWRGGESLNHQRKQKQVCMQTMVCSWPAMTVGGIVVYVVIIHGQFIFTFFFKKERKSGVSQACEKCSTPLVFKEMQVETTMRCLSTIWVAGVLKTQMPVKKLIKPQERTVWRGTK